jgi:hypothetical protein
MADGRLFTDYRPRCDINYVVEGLTADKPMNSYTYKQYLINNASSIMTSQRGTAYNLAACGPCMSPYNEGTMVPEKYVMKCDGQTCSVQLKDARGVGIGRDYGSTAESMQAQAEFLRKKEAEQARLATTANCCASATDKLGYYAPVGTPLDTAAMRASVPSGGAPLSGGDAVL